MSERPSQDRQTSLDEQLARFDAELLRHIRLAQSVIAANNRKTQQQNRDTSSLIDSTAREILEVLQSDSIERKALSIASKTQANFNRSPAQPANIGRFQIRSLIGQGGFGSVYLAYDPHMKREVALKVPLNGHFPTPEHRKRFLREGESAGKLDHPNIAAVYEVGQADGWTYLAMAYCSGPNLSAWVRSRNKPVPIRIAARIGLCLAEAVAHAHTRNVLHRDIKPANVVLSELDPTPSGDELPFVPRLTDFGLSRIEDATHTRTNTGAIIGTPAYMAPEQIDSSTGRPERATDVYGIGSVLYELLVGLPPFVGHSNLEIIRRAASEDPPAPRKLRPEIPIDLETIVLKCLSKQPSQRYTSADELADELRRFLDGRPILARPTSTFTKAWRWCRRYPSAAAAVILAALLVLGAVGGGTLYTWRIRDDYQRTEKLRKQAESLRQASESDRAELQKQLYVAGIRRILAGNDFGEPTPEEWATLEDVLRGKPWPFEFRLLRNAANAVNSLFCQHGDGPLYIALYSPDGKWLGVGGAEGDISIWDSDTAKPVARLREHTNVINALDFSEDGKLLASTSDDKSIRLWDTSTWTCLETVDDADHVPFEILFFHDRDFLAVATSAGAVELRSLADIGKVLATLPVPRLKPGAIAVAPNIAAHPSGRYLAASNLDCVRVFDLDSQTEIHVIPSNETHKPPDLTFSPDGSLLAFAGTDQLKPVVVWSLDPFEEQTRPQIRLSAALAAVGFPSRSIAALVPNIGSPVLIDWVATETTPRRVTPRTLDTSGSDQTRLRYTSSAAHPSGQWLVAGMSNGCVYRKAWNDAPIRSLDTFGALVVSEYSISHDSGVASWITPDSKVHFEPLATTSFDLQSLERSVNQRANTPINAKFAQKAPCFALRDGSQIHLFNEAGNLHQSLDVGLGNPVTAWVISPDARHIAAYVDRPKDSILVVASVDGKRVELTQVERVASNRVLFSHDSNTLFVILSTSLWRFDMHDLDNRFVVEEFRRNLTWPHNLVCSPDNSLLAIAFPSGEIDLRRQDNLDFVNSLDPCGHDVQSIAFSADSQTLVGTHTANRMIEFWNIDTGRHLGSIDGHFAGADIPIKSPDGRYLLVMGRAGQGEPGTMLLIDAGPPNHHRTVNAKASDSGAQSISEIKP